MKKQLSLKEISELSGVSIATLSRYFNNQKIKTTNKEKIQKVLDKTGYTPNIAARFMKGSKTGVIGLIVPEIKHPFFSAIAEGIMQEARKNHQMILCASSESSIEVEKTIISNFAHSILDGLIYIPVSEPENIPNIQSFKNLPLIITARRDLLINTPHIYHAGEKGGYLATKHLISLNRKRIAFFVGFWNPPCNNENILEYMQTSQSRCFSSLDRFRGYLNALKEEGIPYNKNLVVIGKYDHQSGKTSAKILIDNNIEVDSFIAMSQEAADGAIFEFNQKGLQVPTNISVICFDNNRKNSNYNYTHVKLDLLNMGRLSVKALNKIIKKEEVPSDYKIDVQLVLGETTQFK